ncbi:hypothetical protein [Mycetocola sp. JXN-3]|uniref:hypothetical protein n=1 Tax=Mycetocola sp. JXN-3 TaxID=2116510 RepID=UPI00165D177F|nr:hypothetical protein [Mycetocola sp. JXN-3]
MSSARYLVTQERYETWVRGGDPKELAAAIELESAKAEAWGDRPVTWRVEGDAVVVGWDGSSGMAGVSDAGD